MARVAVATRKIDLGLWIASGVLLSFVAYAFLWPATFRTQAIIVVEVPKSAQGRFTPDDAARKLREAVLLESPFETLSTNADGSPGDARETFDVVTKDGKTFGISVTDGDAPRARSMCNELALLAVERAKVVFAPENPLETEPPVAARLIAQAPLPDAPVKPDRPRVLFAGALSAFGFAVAWKAITGLLARRRRAQRSAERSKGERGTADRKSAERSAPERSAPEQAPNTLRGYRAPTAPPVPVFAGVEPAIAPAPPDAPPAARDVPTNGDAPAATRTAAWEGPANGVPEAEREERSPLGAPRVPAEHPGPARRGTQPLGSRFVREALERQRAAYPSSRPPPPLDSSYRYVSSTPPARASTPPPRRRRSGTRPRRPRAPGARPRRRAPRPRSDLPAPRWSIRWLAPTGARANPLRSGIPSTSGAAATASRLGRA